MKKYIVLAGTVVVIVVVTIMVLYFKPECNNMSSTKPVQRHIVEPKERIIVEDYVPSQIVNNSIPVKGELQTDDLSPGSYKTVPSDDIDVNKLIQSVNNANSKVNYIKIEDSDLPPTIISMLQKKHDNLNRYGSYSGGEITHEFNKAESFKEALVANGGIQKILSKLNFVPTDVGAILGEDFTLVGADYSGTLNKGKFNAIFRYYESNIGKRLEISEMYLTPENNYSLDIYEESINFYLGGIPATLQNLKDADNKQIYNLDFVVADRVFSISTEDFSYSELIQTAMQIKTNAKKLSLLDDANS